MNVIFSPIVLFLLKIINKASRDDENKEKRLGFIIISNNVDRTIPFDANNNASDGSVNLDMEINDNGDIKFVVRSDFSTLLAKLCIIVGLTAPILDNKWISFF